MCLRVPKYVHRLASILLCTDWHTRQFRNHKFFFNTVTGQSDANIVSEHLYSNQSKEQLTNSNSKLETPAGSSKDI